MRGPQRAKAASKERACNTDNTVSVHYNDLDVGIAILSIEREKHRRQQRMRLKLRAGSGRVTSASIRRRPQHNRKAVLSFIAVQVSLSYYELQANMRENIADITRTPAQDRRRRRYRGMTTTENLGPVQFSLPARSRTDCFRSREQKAEVKI